MKVRMFELCNAPFLQVFVFVFLFFFSPKWGLLLV
jgi:hypothetical protein